MLGRDNTRRRWLLLSIGLFLALIPPVLLAQAPASPSRNPQAPASSSPKPGSQSPCVICVTGSDSSSKGIYEILVAIIGGLAVVAAAWISSQRTARKTAQNTSQNAINSIDYNEKFRNLDWNKLLNEKTIDAIKKQGKFVVDEEISKKLLMEVASANFARLSEIIGRQGRFVIKGGMLDALLNGEAPDAPRRLWQWMRDDSRVSQMPLNSQEQNAVLLSDLAQAVKNLGAR